MIDNQTVDLILSAFSAITLELEVARLRAQFAFYSISFTISINCSWCLFIASKLVNLSSVSLLNALRESLDGDGGRLLDFPCFAEGIIKNVLKILFML